MAKEFAHKKVTNDQDINCVEFERSSKKVIVGSNDKLIRIIDTNLEITHVLDGHEDAVLDLAFD